MRPMLETPFRISRRDENFGKVLECGSMVLDIVSLCICISFVVEHADSSLMESI